MDSLLTAALFKNASLYVRYPNSKYSIVLPSKITTTEWKMRCREHVHYFRAGNDDCLVQKNSTKLPSKPLKVKDNIIQIDYFCPNISLKPKYM